MNSRYSTYPIYEASVAEWQDDVPVNWDSLALGRVFRRVKRTGFGGEELLSVYRDHGVIPKASRDDNFNKASEDLSPYQLVCSGDLVMNKMKAWQGSIAMSEHRGIVSPAYFVYEPWRRDDERMDPKYIHYLVRSPAYITQYLSRSKGIRVNQWDLDPRAFEKIEVLLPSIKEQTQIAKFLDYETAKIDALIEKQQELIALLQEKRQAVISHAVTKGLNPDAPMRDSGVEWLGEVPAHWGVDKLYHLTSRIGDGLHGTPSYQDGTGMFFVNGNNLENGRIVIGGTTKEVPSAEYQHHHIAMSCSTVLLSINGTIGKVAIYASEKVILGKSAAYINCLSKLDPEFLQDFFQSHNAQRYYELVSTGTTISNLSLDSIRQLKIGLPNWEEQKSIIEFCMNQSDKYERLISVAVAIADKLQERRTALISAAVTGKIDVRDWKAPEFKTEEVA